MSRVECSSEQQLEPPHLLSKDPIAEGTLQVHGAFPVQAGQKLTTHATRLKNEIAAGKLKLISKQARKSDVWNKFFELVDAKTLSPSGHVQCKSCQRFLSYDAGKTGTSHLNRHKCKPTAEHTPATPSTVPASIRDNLMAAFTNWCAKSMRSFDIFSYDEFLKLADNLIATGAHYGSVSAEQLLPHPCAVTREKADNKSCPLERLNA
ncbi:uncharacterized protein LOC144107994 isoform X2 [Amblyomma americanum]